MYTLKQCFDDLFEGVKIDKGLMKRLSQYHLDYLSQSREYLDFFAGNLIGVQVVRFTVANIRRFFTDVIEIDPDVAKKTVLKVTTINHSFPIESDYLNLALMYLIHRFGTEGSLTEEQRNRGMYDAALVFFYRCLVIRQSEWFHFPADPKISQAAYARLSNKFLLKQLGSWKAVMDYRVKEFLNPEAEHKHLQDLLVFEDDKRITYSIGDGENRIRSMYKFYYREFDLAVTTKDMIGSSSATIVDMEGVEKLRDRTKPIEATIAIYQNLIHDKNSFVKPDLVNIIVDINSNTSARMLTQVLEWMADNSTTLENHKRIDEFCRLVLVHSTHLLQEMGQGELNDIGMVLITLKNLYLSTRSTDSELARIRRLGEEIVTRSAGKVNSSLSKATRTAVILYVTLRSFTIGK